MKKLRVIRIVLSVAAALSVTAAIACRSCGLPEWLGCVAGLQLMPAALSLSAGVCFFWLAVTAFIGRAYCSTVCPLGTFQDSVAFMAKKVCRKQGKCYHYSRAENRLRYVVLGVIIVCVAAGQMFLPDITDPYLIYKNFIDNLFAPAVGVVVGDYVFPMLFGVALSLVTFVAIVALSCKNGRTFCNTICPVGSAMSLVSRYSVLQLEIDPDICTNCGKCEMVCKSSCVDSKAHTIDYSRCVLCLNCAAVCDDKAIRFTATRKRLSTPLMRPIKGEMPQMTVDAPGALCGDEMGEKEDVRAGD